MKDWDGKPVPLIYVDLRHKFVTFFESTELRDPKCLENIKNSFGLKMDLIRL